MPVVLQDVTLTPLHINTLLYNLLVGLKYLHSARGPVIKDDSSHGCCVSLLRFEESRRCCCWA